MVMKELKNDGQYKIELDTLSNEFTVSEIVEGTKSFDKLKTFKYFDDAERYIENREKRKEAGIMKKKESLLAIYKDNWKYIDIKITSLSPSSYGDSFDVWITFPDKKRSKNGFYTNDYLKFTDGNKQKVTEIQELRKKADEIEKTLEKYTREELMKHFKDDD